MTDDSFIIGWIHRGKDKKEIIINNNITLYNIYIVYKVNFNFGLTCGSEYKNCHLSSVIEGGLFS